MGRHTDWAKGWILNTCNTVLEIWVPGQAHQKKLGLLKHIKHLRFLLLRLRTLTEVARRDQVDEAALPAQDHRLDKVVDNVLGGAVWMRRDDSLIKDAYNVS